MLRPTMLSVEASSFSNIFNDFWMVEPWEVVHFPLGSIQKCEIMPAAVLHVPSDPSLQAARKRRLATAKAQRLFRRLREGLVGAATQRRLSHDTRRRRTYRYTPWALVTVEDEKG